MADTLSGSWVQDDNAAGIRRQWTFTEDGSYRFFTVAGGTLLADESGSYAVAAEELALTPAAGAPRTVRWKVDKDPYVGDTRLVLGGGEIYYRP